jgi:hypothetical protein
VRGAYTYEKPRRGTELDVLWAAPLQTVRAVLAGALYWGWLPCCWGRPRASPQMLCVIGAFVLVLLGHVFTSVRGIG